MELAEVVGKMWSTKKAECLSPYKLLTVRPLGKDTLLVAADVLDAGVGETVVITGGSSARRDEISSDVPVDATIVAIVDEK